ncbi:MAG TPA: hypothetical protein VGE52_10080, partial [Pirellulales bacterium]
MATLFSVECTTCHRRLQVRKKSAIGQIVNCPACGSMLQIAPPPGWVPPADEPVEAKVKAPSATNPTAKPVATADASIASQKPAPPSPAPAAGRVPTPEELLAATADQPGFPWDKVILAGAVVTALAVVGVGIWVIADGGRKTPVATNAEATIETTAPAAAPLSTAAAPAPTGLETTTAATPQPTGEATAPQAVPAATSEATGAAPAATSDAPQAAPPETDPPMNPAPGDPAMPAPNAPQEGPAEPLPPAAPMPAPEPEAPRAPLPAAVDVDVPARMADPLKKVEFSDLPLSEAVDFVAQLTGLSITLDVDGIAQAGATPSDKVSAKLRDSTVGDLLDTILTQRGLAYVVEEGRVRVTARAAQAGEVVTAAFNVADLDGGDSAKTESLATMIRTVVTPGVWETDKAVK